MEGPSSAASKPILKLRFIHFTYFSLYKIDMFLHRSKFKRFSVSYHSVIFYSKHSSNINGGSRTTAGVFLQCSHFLSLEISSVSQESIIELQRGVRNRLLDVMATLSVQHLECSWGGRLESYIHIIQNTIIIEYWKNQINQNGIYNCSRRLVSSCNGV